MSLSSVGKFEIYADTGIDQWALLQERVRQEVENKKLRDGQRRTMLVDFDEPLIVTISVAKMPQEKLL